MATTVETLREISTQCRQGRPMAETDAVWLAAALERFLSRQCGTLEDAFGLHYPRGGVPWWSEEAIRIRDRAIRELAERFLDGRSVNTRAREIRTLALRYGASAWRFDAAHAEMPAGYTGTPKEYLFRAFRSGARMPLSERQLRNILA